MKTGIELISKERQRQIDKEGWTAENDDANSNQEMTYAAKAYLETAVMFGLGQKVDVKYIRHFFWPASWNPSWCKPTNQVRDLTKAGALIAAEIDRLNRIVPTE